MMLYSFFAVTDVVPEFINVLTSLSINHMMHASLSASTNFKVQQCILIRQMSLGDFPKYDLSLIEHNNIPFCSVTMFTRAQLWA